MTVACARRITGLYDIFSRDVTVSAREVRRDGKTESEKPPCLSLYRLHRNCGNRAAADRLAGGRPTRLVLLVSSLCHIYRAVYSMGNFRPQADHSAPGPSLSHRCFRADGNLGNGQDGPVFIRRGPLGPALSLVSVLSAHAVHPAAGGVRRPVAGQAGKLSPSVVDGTSLYTHRRTFAAGTDQRPASACICLPGRRDRMGK